MAPAKGHTQRSLARHKANASWNSWRSVDAPPKRISELIDDPSITEDFTPIPAQHERQSPALIPQVYQHCQFCGDFSMDLITCVKCKKKVCTAAKLGGSGCVLKETIPVELVNVFQCPDCHVGPMSAWFQGYAIVGYNIKVLWPAAIITLSLYSTDDSYYAARRVQLDMEHHFRHAPNNLCVTHLTMKGNGQRSQQKLAEPSCNFLEQAMSGLVPANVVVFIDTHSDGGSGYLQFSGGKSGGCSAPVDEVLEEFIGQNFLNLAAKSSTLAADLKMNREGFDTRYPQYDGAILGGFRVLIIMSCGPAMTKEGHLMRVTKLVTEFNMFDLVIGFSGEATLPEHVVTEILELIRCITTNSSTDIWQLLNRTFKHSEKILHQTPLVAIFWDNGSVRTIEFGLHEPPSRVLGAKLWCGAPEGQCQPGPGDLTYKNNNSGTRQETIRQKCRRCGYVSGWLAVKDVDWVHLLPGSRRVYWHDYPITPLQQMLFTSVARPVDQEKGMAKRGRGISPIGGQPTKKGKRV